MPHHRCGVGELAAGAATCGRLRRFGRWRDRSHPPARFTATSAATTTPDPSVSEAVPMPLFIACFMPKILPTVAPVPAPTLPSAIGPALAARRCLLAHFAGRTNMRAADPEIEQDGAGNDGHAGDAGVDSRSRAFRENCELRKWSQGRKRCRRRGRWHVRSAQRAPGFSVSSSQEPVAEPRISTPPTPSVPQRIDRASCEGDRVGGMTHEDAGNIGQPLHINAVC